MTRIIAIASGGKAAGKTSIAANLAAQLAQQGQRVCLLDTAAPGSGVCKLLALDTHLTLRDVVRGKVDSGSIAVPHEDGFDVISAGLDETWASQPDDEALERLAGALAGLDVYDFILVDCNSSLAQGLLAFLLASPEMLLVVTADSASLSGAYGLLKLLYSEQFDGTLNLVVNRAQNRSTGRHCYDKFREVAKFYLDMQVPLAGLVSEDPLVDKALRAHCLLGRLDRNAPAFRDIAALAGQLLDNAAGAMILNSATYARAYLQAAAAGCRNDADRIESFDSRPDFDNDGDLYRQLDFLSGQVDRLISELARLRGAGTSLHRSDSVADNSQPQFAGNPQQESTGDSVPCTEACIAAMATKAVTVTAQGETFSVYQLRKANGEQQRFAFQTIDNGLEEHKPQTSSS